MLKQLFEYVVELRKPFMYELDGRMYSDKRMEEVVKIPYADSFTLTTLSSLVEYIKSNVDTMKGHMFVHVKSPTCVEVFSQLDVDRKREKIVTVCASLPTIQTDTYIEREKFNIALQSKFVPNEDRDLLLRFVGTVEDGTVAEYGDDGVTQKATVKTGIASKGDAIVPNPVVLMPYRTFTEVGQPASAFVFRMKSDKYDGITCAIYEADGGVWKNKAMENIKDYLKYELAGVEGYTII